MNKDNLNRMNAIEQEIKEIDIFISNYISKPRRINLGLFKRKFRFSLQMSGYGYLPKIAYNLPCDLNDEILKVVKDYREKLVAEQNELWGTK